jgi:hypothetical protein
MSTSTHALVDHDPAAMLQSAVALVKAAGYRVSKPRQRVQETPKLNCLGLPMSPLYDPNWKRKTPLTSIARLSSPQKMPMTQEQLAWKRGLAS